MGLWIKLNNKLLYAENLEFQRDWDVSSGKPSLRIKPFLAKVKGEYIFLNKKKEPKGGIGSNQYQSKPRSPSKEKPSSSSPKKVKCEWKTMADGNKVCIGSDGNSYIRGSKPGSLIRVNYKSGDSKEVKSYPVKDVSKISPQEASKLIDDGELDNLLPHDARLIVKKAFEEDEEFGSRKEITKQMKDAINYGRADALDKKSADEFINKVEKNFEKKYGSKPSAYEISYEADFYFSSNSLKTKSGNYFEETDEVFSHYSSKWIKGVDSSQKADIVMFHENNPLYSSLTKYDLYKGYYTKDFKTYSDFNSGQIKLYRGGDIYNAPFISFTPSKSIAQKFADMNGVDLITKKVNVASDIIGFVATGESEVFVSGDIF